MKKRALLTGLWFYATWTAGSFVAFLTGATADPAIVPALLAAGLVWTDPRATIWRPARPSARTAQPAAIEPARS